jgi:hypothetical protein
LSASLRPAPERRIGLGERRCRRNNLGHAICAQARLDEADEHVRGHGVEFDTAAGKQEFDLVVGRAVDARPPGDRVAVLVDVDPLGFKAEPLDLSERQPQVDGLDPVLETLAPAAPGQRLLDREPGDVEVVQDEQPEAQPPAELVDQQRAAVTLMPLVENGAMSNRSEMRAAWRIGVKPSFSTNGAAS